MICWIRSAISHIRLTNTSSSVAVSRSSGNLYRSRNSGIETSGMRMLRIPVNYNRGTMSLGLGRNGKGKYTGEGDGNAENLLLIKSVFKNKIGDDGEERRIGARDGRNYRALS